MVRLITVLTQEPEFLKQLHVFSDSLNRHSHQVGSLCHTCLSPSFSAVAVDIPAFSHLTVDVGKARDDRFFAKFAYGYFARDSGDKGDDLLYLDVDHICRAPLFLPSLEYDEVFLASDVEEIEAILADATIDSLRTRLPFLRSHSRLLHYNSSLVFGKAGTLGAIVDDWRKLYDLMYWDVSHQYLEEVSLSFALMRRRVKIRTVSTGVQGSFRNPDPQCCLFHYGGASSSAGYIKRGIATGSLGPREVVDIVNGVLSGSIPPFTRVS